jgi:hypothetical protein
VHHGIIKKRIMRSSALVVVLGVGVIALAGCGGDKKPKKVKAAPGATATQTVGVAVVASQAVPRQINATGTISPWEEVVVGAETGGLTAIGVSAEEGDTVKAGQVLVKLNDTLLSAQLRQQDAGVASARASLAEAEAALRRSRELQGQGLSVASLARHQPGSPADRFSAQVASPPRRARRDRRTPGPDRHPRAGRRAGQPSQRHQGPDRQHGRGSLPHRPRQPPGAGRRDPRNRPGPGQAGHAGHDRLREGR